MSYLDKNCDKKEVSKVIGNLNRQKSRTSDRQKKMNPRNN